MQTIITIVLQLLLGLVATFGIYFGGIGNGWELVAFSIVHAAVVSIVGIVIQRIGSKSISPGREFIGALIGSSIGASILLIPRAWGFLGVLLPIIGAIIGYHLSARISQ